MALWMDGVPSTTEDLRAYESSILETARSEQIDLSTKLVLAQREISGSLHLFLVEQTAAEGTAPATTVNQVVLTADLIHWHTLRAIELTYRDAFHSHLNDRHQLKWQEHVRLAREAGNRTFESGVGIVNLPVARALGVTVRGVPGVMAPGIYEIRVTWQNALGQEGSPSEANVFVSEAGMVPEIQPGLPPPNAVAWNAYAAPLGQSPRRQNSSPLAVDARWTAPATGLSTGVVVGSGQIPDRYLRASQTLVRA